MTPLTIFSSGRFLLSVAAEAADCHLRNVSLRRQFPVTIQTVCFNFVLQFFLGREYLEETMSRSNSLKWIVCDSLHSINYFIEHMSVISCESLDNLKDGLINFYSSYKLMYTVSRIRIGCRDHIVSQRNLLPNRSPQHLEVTA